MGSWTRRKLMLMLLAAPAAVAIWAGWVSLGRMCGFGKVELLPGIVDWQLDISITLPVGMEAYAAYALGMALDKAMPEATRQFASRSSWAALGIGILGQAAYHTMTAWGWAKAPTPVVIAVSCLPVVVLGMGARLMHLSSRQTEAEAASPASHEEAEPTHPLGLLEAEARQAIESATQKADGYWPLGMIEAESALVRQAIEAARPPASQDEGTLLYLPLPARQDEGTATQTEADRKAEARRLILAGYSAADAASQLGVDKSSVYRWTKDIRTKEAH